MSALCQKRTIEGDALDLSQCVPEQVDYVVFANTFHGMPDKTGLATVVGQVLKPHGNGRGDGKENDERAYRLRAFRLTQFASLRAARRPGRAVCISGSS
jgi:hypothetical protein